ncbi:MAG: cation diffusion facilitator family transporter [bacterium]
MRAHRQRSPSTGGLYSPQTCTKIGLWVNVCLVAVKMTAGILGKSQAMLADSLNSATDVVSTGIVYMGLKASAKPPDEKHPYGHGGIDTVVALGVILILLATGIVAGLGAVRCLFGNGELSRPGPVALYAAIFSIILKEVMFRYTFRVGKKSNSPSVIANAWDHRADVYSSIAALIGIAGARMGYLYLDPIAGLFVSYMIIRISVTLIRSNLGEIIHEAPSEETIETIQKEVLVVPGVRRVRRARVHRVGHARFLDVDIQVDGGLTVTEGHDIATRVKFHLRDSIEHVSDVMVHVEPES